MHILPSILIHQVDSLGQNRTWYDEPCSTTSPITSSDQSITTTIIWALPVMAQWAFRRANLTTTVHTIPSSLGTTRHTIHHTGIASRHTAFNHTCLRRTTTPSRRYHRSRQSHTHSTSQCRMLQVRTIGTTMTGLIRDILATLLCRTTVITTEAEEVEEGEP